MLKKVQRIISEQFGLEVDDVQPDSNLMDDLGADSLDFVELIMAVEQEFDIEISEEVASKIKTVQDMIDYIESNQTA